MEYFVGTFDQINSIHNLEEAENKIQFRQLTDGRFAVNKSVQEIWPQIDWSLFTIEELTPEDFPTNSTIA